MRTSTKFLIAFVLSAGVLLLSASAGLLLAVAADLGYRAAWPNTWWLAAGLSVVSGVAATLLSVPMASLAWEHAEKERR